MEKNERGARGYLVVICKKYILFVLYYMERPCPPGKERNAVTKRCRKVKTSSLKPCPPGKQRNAVTKRCRKVKTSSPKSAKSSPKSRTPLKGRLPKIGELKKRTLPDVMYLDGFEIYPDKLYQVRDDLYIDTNNILFEYNDTTMTLKEVGEWDSERNTPVMN